MRFDKYPQIIFKSSKISDGNMSTIKGEQNQAVKNRRSFLKKYGLKLDHTINMFLEHGNNIVMVGNKELGKGSLDTKDGIKSDGIVTAQKDIFLMVITGDCLPIGFYDTKKQIIALIHASRKNLESGLLENTVKIFVDSLKSKPGDLIVSIGPSIGPCCYYTDLWSFTKKKLEELGIPQENIFNPEICTYHSNQYFSHRKAIEKNLPEDFRFVTILGIKNVN